jgi:HD-like signal output (HDOD) protein
MSEKAAEDWLSNHQGALPAFDDSHHRVIEMLRLGIASMAEIADVAILDPGMNCRLLHAVNSKLKQSKRPAIDTVHTAVGHLGKPTITKLLREQKVLSDLCNNTVVLQNYRQLLSKTYHALEQMTAFSQLQGIHAIDDMRSAMLLRSIGELYVCLFDTDRYQQHLQQVRQKKDLQAGNSFDFNFTELGRQLAKKYVLPELLSESFGKGRNTSLKARIIQLAADIADQAELGWQHKGMRNAQKNCANSLNLKPQDAWQHIVGASLQAARNAPIDDVLPAAARLIMLPDVDKPAKAEARKPTAKTATQAISLSQQLKAMVQLPNPTQSQVLGLLLKGLHEDLNFSRVALMLISKDNNKILTRAGKGIPDDSPFLKLDIDIAQLGLLKSLMEKPQALSVNATSYKKYEPLLPGKFKATCLCNSFVLMSFFIGNKPAGMVYADRSRGTEEIDSATYQEFKSSVMTTGKILTYLAKHKTQASA